MFALKMNKKYETLVLGTSFVWMDYSDVNYIGEFAVVKASKLIESSN